VNIAGSFESNGAPVKFDPGFGGTYSLIILQYNSRLVLKDVSIRRRNDLVAAI
jgi:hypothetical protein